MLPEGAKIEVRGRNASTFFLFAVNAKPVRYTLPRNGIIAFNLHAIEVPDGN
jgi:hypothetical protein